MWVRQQEGIKDSPERQQLCNLNSGTLELSEGDRMRQDWAVAQAKKTFLGCCGLTAAPGGVAGGQGKLGCGCGSDRQM